MRAWLLVWCLLLAACSPEDLHTRFPAATPPLATTGTVVLLMNDEAGISVAIDGWLVVSCKRTSRVVIDGVPLGTRTVTITAAGHDKEVKVEVAGDHATTVPIGVPDSSSGSGILGTIIEAVVSIGLYTLLK